MKRGMVVSTIFYVIIAVVFLFVFANLLFNWFGNIPTVRGAIGSTSQVICFGGGDDQTVHCLEKINGTEIFFFKAARNWGDDGAESTPALADEGIFFGVNDHVCAYSSAGQSLWECGDFNKKITSKVVFNDAHVCFGTEEKYYCVERKNGIQARDFGEPKTPFIAVDDKSAYYANKQDQIEVEVEPGKSTECAGKTIKISSAPMPHVILDIDGEEYTVYEGEQYTIGDLVIEIVEIDMRNYKTYVTIKAYVDGSINKYKLDRAEDDWSATLRYPVDSEITILNDIFCFGAYKDEHCSSICLNKGDGSSVLSYSGIGKATTPAIDDDYVYMSLGKSFYKINITSKKMAQYILLADEISTGIALDNGTACFAGGSTFYCYDTNPVTPKKLFSVDAPVGWDFRDTESTPVILDEVVYFAMGDHVCAYETNSTGAFIGDEGAKWCADFDEKIKTDLAGLPAKELEASE